MITGAMGPYASFVNGVYEPMSEWHNGRMLLRKQGDTDAWLRYTPCKLWMICSTGDKDANSDIGWGRCKEWGLCDPTEASSWEMSMSNTRRVWAISIQAITVLAITI